MKALLFLLLILLNVSYATKEKKDDKFESIEVFNKILYLVESQYYQKVDSKKLIEGAIKGMMRELDPHTNFLTEDLFKKIKNDTEGSFGGIGVEVTIKDGEIIVVSVLPKSPAQEEGLKAKDRIVQIEGKKVSKIGPEEAMMLLQGEVGSYLKMSLQRKGVEKEIAVKIKRRIIEVEPVEGKLLPGKIAWLKIQQFQKNTSNFLLSNLEKLQKKSKSLQGIILDLRGNPGGLLDEAVNVASIFLSKGIVVSTEARDPNNKDIRYVKKSIKKYLSTPLIVLVNSSSASAAEIVAGALQDHKRALIMGERTFGKGTVQTVSALGKKQNYGLKLTVAQYLTPNKRKIQAIGVTPDIYVPKMNPDELLSSHETSQKDLRESDLENHVNNKKLKSLYNPTDELIRLKLDYQVQQAASVLYGHNQLAM